MVRLSEDPSSGALMDEFNRGRRLAMVCTHSPCVSCAAMVIEAGCFDLFVWSWSHVGPWHNPHRVKTMLAAHKIEMLSFEDLTMLADPGPLFAGETGLPS